jgi:sialidase-1
LSDDEVTSLGTGGSVSTRDTVVWLPMDRVSRGH